MHNPDEHVALAPEIVRNADATDNGAAETERVHRQRLASWDVAAVRVERIAHRITGVAVRAVGTVALAMMVFDWGNGGALMEWIRQTMHFGCRRRSSHRWHGVSSDAGVDQGPFTPRVAQMRVNAAGARGHVVAEHHMVAEL